MVFFVDEGFIGNKKDSKSQKRFRAHQSSNSKEKIITMAMYEQTKKNISKARHYRRKNQYQ